MSLNVGQSHPSINYTPLHDDDIPSLIHVSTQLNISWNRKTEREECREDLRAYENMIWTCIAKAISCWTFAMIHSFLRSWAELRQDQGVASNKVRNGLWFPFLYCSLECFFFGDDLPAWIRGRVKFKDSYKSNREPTTFNSRRHWLYDDANRSNYILILTFSYFLYPNSWSFRTWWPRPVFFLPVSPVTEDHCVLSLI